MRVSVRKLKKCSEELAEGIKRTVPNSKEEEEEDREEGRREERVRGEGKEDDILAHPQAVKCVVTVCIK